MARPAGKESTFTTMWSLLGQAPLLLQQSSSTLPAHLSSCLKWFTPALALYEHVQNTVSLSFLAVWGGGVFPFLSNSWVLWMKTCHNYHSNGQEGGTYPKSVGRTRTTQDPERCPSPSGPGIWTPCYHDCHIQYALVTLQPLDGLTT